MRFAMLVLARGLMGFAPLGLAAGLLADNPALLEASGWCAAAWGVLEAFLWESAWDKAEHPRPRRRHRRRTRYRTRGPRLRRTIKVPNR